MFLESKREDKMILDSLLAGISVDQSALNFFMNAILFCGLH